MQIRRSRDCAEIVANDGCRLRELLHPERGTAGLPYSLAVARLDPGQRTFPHVLTGETEVYYVTRGTGRMHVEDEVEDVRSGDALVVPAGAVQWIENTGDDTLEFLNVVSPPWRADHDVRRD